MTLKCPATNQPLNESMNEKDTDWDLIGDIIREEFKMPPIRTSSSNDSITSTCSVESSTSTLSTNSIHVNYTSSTETCSEGEQSDDSMHPNVSQRRQQTTDEYLQSSLMFLSTVATGNEPFKSYDEKSSVNVSSYTPGCLDFYDEPTFYPLNPSLPTEVLPKSTWNHNDFSSSINFDASAVIDQSQTSIIQFDNVVSSQNLVDENEVMCAVETEVVHSSEESSEEEMAEGCVNYTQLGGANDELQQQISTVSSSSKVSSTPMTFSYLTPEPDSQLQPESNNMIATTYQHYWAPSHDSELKTPNVFGTLTAARNLIHQFNGYSPDNINTNQAPGIPVTGGLSEFLSPPPYESFIRSKTISRVHHEQVQFADSLSSDRISSSGQMTPDNDINNIDWSKSDLHSLNNMWSEHTGAQNHHENVYGSYLPCSGYANEKPENYHSPEPVTTQPAPMDCTKEPKQTVDDQNLRMLSQTAQSHSTGNEVKGNGAAAQIAQRFLEYSLKMNKRYGSTMNEATMKIFSQQFMRNNLTEKIRGKMKAPEPYRRPQVAERHGSVRASWTGCSSALGQTTDVHNARKQVIAGKERRSRTSFTQAQITELEAYFNDNPYLTRELRLVISQRLNLNEQQVKVWFQNHRMKSKRTVVERSTRSSPRRGRPSNVHMSDDDVSVSSSIETRSVVGKLLSYSPALGQNFHAHSPVSTLDA